VASQPDAITVDRISSAGNAIAENRVQGKVVHAPVADIGATLEVRLIDKGSHFEAKLVDRADEAQPRQTSTTSTADLDKGRSTSTSHSFSVGASVTGDTSGRELRNWASSRKL
jgi:hypothetical protein